MKGLVYIEPLCNDHLFRMTFITWCIEWSFQAGFTALMRVIFVGSMSWCTACSANIMHCFFWHIIGKGRGLSSCQNLPVIIEISIIQNRCYCLNFLSVLMWPLLLPPNALKSYWRNFVYIFCVHFPWWKGVFEFEHCRSDLARQYRTKRSQMELKQAELDRLGHEFENKLRITEVKFLCPWSSWWSV